MAVTVLVCGLAIGAVGQTAAPRQLRVGKSVPASWSGRYGGDIHGGVRCDAEGDLYFQPVGSITGELSVADPVEEIRVDGTAGSEFSLRDVSGPSKYDLEADSFGQLNASVEDFAINKGRVYLSVRRCTPPSANCSMEIVAFDNDGQQPSVTRLAYNGIAHFMPQHLAVFPDGRFFVGGLLEAPGRPFGWYAGIYDSDGKLHSAVSNLPGDIEPKPAFPGAMNDMAYAHNVGLSMIADDGKGNVYLLRPIKRPTLYVITESGTILHHSQIVPPFRDAVPVSMDNAGDGKVVLQFGKQVTEGEVMMSGNFLSIVDTRTGITLADYTADGKSGGIYGCFLPNSGFEFMSPWERPGSWVIHFDPAQ